MSASPLYKDALAELAKRCRILYTSKLVNWVGIETSSDQYEEILSLPGIINAYEERKGDFLFPTEG